MNKVKDKYNKETGMFATNSDGCFTEDYSDWLEEIVEKQLTLTDVVPSLPKSKKQKNKETIWDVKTRIAKRNIGKLR